MIYYFIPATVRAGGIKVACQFVTLLIQTGRRAVIVTPNGDAPQWFHSSTPVIPESIARERIQSDDWKMITWPPDYTRLESWPGKFVNHCQGTDQLMDAIFADPNVPILSCWQQANDYVHTNHSRETIDVGISISDCFIYDGSQKLKRQVAYMPRRGHEIAERCHEENEQLDFFWVDGLDEIEVATTLKLSTYFLAISIGEEFGLPALEAMASGCVVLSVPVKGGMEYLHHLENCIVVEPDQLGKWLSWISLPSQASLRMGLSRNAIATACRYRLHDQAKRLRQLSARSLSWLK
ncbi:MAG: hypothetical protein ACI8P9_004384 [Parasphingorhabdus sp.]|jgi:hypothetical protein